MVNKVQTVMSNVKEKYGTDKCTFEISSREF